LDCDHKGKIKEEHVCVKCGSENIEFKYSEKQRNKTQTEVDSLYRIFSEDKTEEKIEESPSHENVEVESVKYEIKELTEKEANLLAIWLNENQEKNTQVFFEGRNINTLL